MTWSTFNNDVCSLTHTGVDILGSYTLCRTTKLCARNGGSPFSPPHMPMQTHSWKCKWACFCALCFLFFAKSTATISNLYSLNINFSKYKNYDTIWGYFRLQSHTRKYTRRRHLEFHYFSVFTGIESLHVLQCIEQIKKLIAACRTYTRFFKLHKTNCFKIG